MSLHTVSTFGPCESCGKPNHRTMNKTLMVCPDCLILEQEAQAELERGAEDRIAAHNEEWKKRAEKVNHALQVNTDIFNAQTIAIVELKKLIDSDESVPSNEKHEILAQLIKEHHAHMQQVLFPAKNLLSEITSSMRADEQYLHELRNKLSREAIERLKLEDINYKPTEPKVLKTPKAPKVVSDKDATPRKRAPKLNMAELNKHAEILSKELGMPATHLVGMLQNVQLSQAFETVAEAASFFRGKFGK